MVIFYADDDAEEIELFADVVTSIDPSIKCVFTTDGQSAIKLLASIPSPDRIFLDLNMPRMNGRECLIAIKAIPRLRDIPVIIYSSLVTELEILMLREAGASQVVRKPNNIRTLRQMLRSILFPLPSIPSMERLQLLPVPKSNPD